MGTPRVGYPARQVPVKGGYRIETLSVRYPQCASGREDYRIETPRVRYPPKRDIG